MRAILKDKGQVTLPARIRKALSAKTGDVFDVDIVMGKVVLTPQVMQPVAIAKGKVIDIDRYFGSLKGAFGSVAEIDSTIREGRDSWD